MDAAGLTEQQRKWFASVRAGLEAKTGRTIAEWVAIARTCPETKPRARLAWFKEHHGLLQNHASIVFHELASATGGGIWSEPDDLRAALWRDPGAAAILASVEGVIATLPGAITGQRKGYTAWSRAYQFAAARPVRGGVRLGLAVAPEANARLELAKRSEGWSERLTAATTLVQPAEVDGALRTLLAEAHARS